MEGEGGEREEERKRRAGGSGWSVTSAKVAPGHWVPRQ